MRKFLVFVLVLSSIMIGTSAHADSELRYSGFNVFHLDLTDDSGSKVSYSGTYNQIQDQISKLREQAIAMSSQVQLGDSCRIIACYKKIVDVSTGEVEIVPLSDEEITAREIETAKSSAKYFALLESAGNNYLDRASAVYAISVSVGGNLQTIQGTPQQIADQVQRLRSEANALKESAGVDPCSMQTCYKTIVDLQWGLAPAITTTIPLSAEDLAQRVIDRNQAAMRAEDIATAAELGLVNGPAPVYRMEVSSRNSSFGTSGTREQLAAVVAQLTENAVAAAETANNLANNPIVERHVIVDLHWGLAPATTTVIEKEITGAERDARIASANAEASNAAALAQAAQQSLNAIP